MMSSVRSSPTHNRLSIEIDSIVSLKPNETLCVDKPNIVNIGLEDEMYHLDFEKERCSIEKLFSETTPERCPILWDSIVCWPQTQVNQTVSLSCPYYVNFFNTKNHASRSCEYDPVDGKAVWSAPNYNECLTYSKDDYCHTSCKMEDHLDNIVITRKVGYVLSMVILSISMIVLSRPKLRCPRNNVHLNLFLAFALRTILVIIIDTMIYESDDTSHTLTSFYFRCRLTMAVFRYLSSVYQTSLFTQALYLSIIIKFPYFSETMGAKLCILISWILPCLWTIPWVFSRSIVDNYWCWQVESDMNLIIKIPHLVLLVLNIACAVFIIRNLYSKTKPKNMNMGKMRKYRRLARTIVILIPIFGLHFTFFSWVSYITRVGMQVGNCSQVVVTYIQTFLNAFAGLAISFTSCFIHKENRIELVLFGVEVVKKCRCLRSTRFMRFLDSDYITQMRYLHYFHLDPRTAYSNTRYIHRASSSRFVTITRPMTSAQDETIVSFTSIGETPYEDSNKPDMEVIELKTPDKQKEPEVESQND